MNEKQIKHKNARKCSIGHCRAMIYYTRAGDQIRYHLACAYSEVSNQAAHTQSLIRVFIFRLKKRWALGYPIAPIKDRSDWANAQADLSLKWAHMQTWNVAYWACNSIWHQGLWSGIAWQTKLKAGFIDPPPPFPADDKLPVWESSGRCLATLQVW